MWLRPCSLRLRRRTHCCGDCCSTCWWRFQSNARRLLAAHCCRPARRPRPVRRRPAQPPAESPCRWTPVSAAGRSPCVPCRSPRIRRSWPRRPRCESQTTAEHPMHRPPAYRFSYKFQFFRTFSTITKKFSSRDLYESSVAWKRHSTKIVPIL